MPLSARLDCMVLTTMTKRIFPLSGLGPLTKEYTLSSDYDDRWRAGGLVVPTSRACRAPASIVYTAY
jgi:hypothetical protein